MASQSNLEKDRTWTDPVKDWAMTGLAALFMTEDSIRKRVKDLKLPKELIVQLLEGAGKKKSELYQLIANEIKDMLSKTDLSAAVKEFLSENRIQFEAKITFEPKHEKKHTNK